MNQARSALRVARRVALVVRIRIGRTDAELQLACLFFAAALLTFAWGAPPQVASDQPYKVEYYYKTQWGHQQEFLDLSV
jgi:hypothetical protein